MSASPPTVTSPVCFRRETDHRSFPEAQSLLSVQHSLSIPRAQAFSEIMTVLGCGEESAIIAFEGLALNDSLPAPVQNTLTLIAHEESYHESLLGSVRSSLPAAVKDSLFLRTNKRFFISLQTHEVGTHLANIAALDSGVCVIINTFYQAGFFDQEPKLSKIFARIQQDEARHAGQALTLAKQYAPSQTVINQQAEKTREGLKQVLNLRAEALERLGIDWKLLERRLERLPGAFA